MQAFCLILVVFLAFIIPQIDGNVKCAILFGLVSRHYVYICTEQNDVFIDYKTGESVTLCDCKLPRQPIHTQADYEIGAFVTESSSEYIISLVNRREDGSPVDSVVILLREDIAANSMKAVMVTPYGSSTVDKTSNTLTIPRLDSGCIIFLTKTS